MEDLLERMVNYIDMQDDSFILFLQEHDLDSKSIYLFFEGDDDISFYLDFIKSIYIGYETYTYVCGGKKNVLLSYDDIQQTEHKRNKVLFFIDKDFDEPKLLNKNPNPIQENLFITTYHSIENYLTTTDAFEKMLILSFNFRKPIHDEIIKDLKIKYNQLHQQFSDKTLSIFAWALYQRKHNRNMIFDKLNLDKFLIIYKFELFEKKYKKTKILQEIRTDNNISNFTKSLLVSKKRLNLLNSLTETTTPDNCWNEIRQLTKDLKHTNTRKTIRGKQDKWFFIKVFQMLKRSIIPNYIDKISTKNRTLPVNKIPNFTNGRVELNEDNLIDLLTPKIDIPNDLKIFLQSNYQKLN